MNKRVMRLLLTALFILLSYASPKRLKIQGKNLVNDEGKAVRLTGFNWVLSHVHANDGAYMKSLMPNATVARLVGILWDNSNHDCYSPNPPNFFNDDCFDDLDNAITQATKARVWVILTCRSKYGAGQNYQTDPDSDLFWNTTLRQQFFSMWMHVVNRYKSWDFIAAYEILSEPRDKSVSKKQVHDFYRSGCAVVKSADSVTPCMVGSSSYYKLWTFTEDILITDNPNVIYTFDYFVPDAWSFGRSSVPKYPATYRCKDLYKGWVSQNCPNGANADSIFNKAWNRKNFEKWALPISNHNVPVFVNQWGVVHGIDESHGRYQYMSDVAALLQAYGWGWTWWVFRGGGGDTWSHGSMEFVYQHSDGTLEVDQKAVDAVSPYMG